MKPTRGISPPGTYFVTFITWERRRLFVVEAYVRLFLKTMYSYRRKEKFQLHAFVLMPEHVHLLLTPANDLTLERTITNSSKAGTHTHLALNSDLGKSGREDLRIIGSAMRRIFQRIGITSIRIR